MKGKKTYCIVESPKNCGLHYDSWQEITMRLKAEGWVKSSNLARCGIILLKQCCMTTEEINQAIQELAKLGKKNVQARIFLGECLSQTKELVEVFRKKFPNLDVNTFTSVQEFFEKLGGKYEELQTPILSVFEDSAIITIAYGCNRRCSFCKTNYKDVPFSSVPLELILQKIEQAKAKGIRKIVLNASNSTQYNDNGRHFQELLEAVLAIPDVYYQVNGITMVELTDNTIEILKNPRFFCVQIEAQSFIPEVRKYMGVGDISIERMLFIFEQMKGKMILSNLIVGFYKEREKNFQEQLKLIQEKKFFFLSITNLVATPGTPAASLNNPSKSLVKYRTLEAVRTLGKIRQDIAQEMLGKEQTCMVISKSNHRGVILLAENGVLIRSKNFHWNIGQKVKVIPKQIHGLFHGDDQLLILDEEIGEAIERNFDASLMSDSFFNSVQKACKNNMGEAFNRTDLSLRAYCEKRFLEELIIMDK